MFGIILSTIYKSAFPKWYYYCDVSFEGQVLMTYLNFLLKNASWIFGVHRNFYITQNLKS